MVTFFVMDSRGQSAYISSRFPRFYGTCSIQRSFIEAGSYSLKIYPDERKENEFFFFSAFATSFAALEWLMAASDEFLWLKYNKKTEKGRFTSEISSELFPISARMINIVIFHEEGKVLPLFYGKTRKEIGQYQPIVYNPLLRNFLPMMAPPNPVSFSIQVIYMRFRSTEKTSQFRWK